MGSPPVSERFWSNSLNEFVSDRNRHMVTEDMTIGSLMRTSACQGFAPSICAASIRSPGTF